MKGSKKKRVINWSMVRFSWAALMLLGFFIFSMPLAPSGESGDWSQGVSSAAMNYTLREDSAHGAPQQAVVNGWYTNDLLAVQTKIAGDQKEQAQHITLMLFFLGLGVLGDRVFHSAGAFRDKRDA
ncbi:hypothetical protein [Kocuria tytonis]|nr:hypothetical protein [Kocuria tytonis]